MLPLTELVFFLNKWDFTIHRRKWEPGVKVLGTRGRSLPRSDQLLWSERGFSIDKNLMVLSVVRKFCELLTPEANLKGEYFSLDLIIVEKHGKRSSWKIIIQRANRRLQVDYWKFRRKKMKVNVRSFAWLLPRVLKQTSLSCLCCAFIFQVRSCLTSLPSLFCHLLQGVSCPLDFACWRSRQDWCPYRILLP